jgi:hypothetical protein
MFFIQVEESKVKILEITLWNHDALYWVYSKLHT